MARFSTPGHGVMRPASSIATCHGTADVCSNRLQAIFATCLLRRRKDSLLDGKKLVELPPKDLQLVKLEFTPEEREIYHAVC